MSASGCKQRGVTLIELMVVVAIVGIVAGLSLKSFKSDEAGTDARQVAGMMSTAYRLAVQGGAVRPDVVTALQPPYVPPPPAPPQLDKFPFARTKLEITFESGVHVLRVWRMVEGTPGTWSWNAVNGIFLSDETSIAGVDTTAAALTPTGTTPPSPVWPIYIYYYPDGSADSVTIFLENKDGKGKRYRVVGLPLVPAPQVFIDW